MKGKNEDSSKLGMNRTGIKASPIDGPRMIEGAERLTPLDTSNEPGSYVRMTVRGASLEGSMGTVPPATTPKGMAKTAIKMLRGLDPSVLIDKLGARLAFERAGVRLYDAALVKLAAHGSWEGGPDVAGLKHIRAEELEHFHMLCECVESLGADPTAVTPAANVEAMASEGIVKLLNDPRSSLSQALEGLMIAELADNACWENLIQLARSMGQDDFAVRFEEALRQENEHLAMVRGWMERRMVDAAHLELEEAPPS